MGGADKALVEAAGRPLLAHLLARLQPQCARILLNTNGNPADFSGYGLPIVADRLGEAPGTIGPLAGVLAACEYAANAWPEVSGLITIPVDTPAIPLNIVARLSAAEPSTQAAVATAGGRAHWLVSRWPLAALPALRQAIEHGHTRRVADALHTLGVTEVPFPEPDNFKNLNTVSDVRDFARSLTQP